jgi:phosphatidylethanolamine-binding protein (PEBP) family uncharacterized protein
MPLELTSTAFKQGETIAKQYTEDGQNASPPLKWDDPPAGTRSLALVCEDQAGATKRDLLAAAKGHVLNEAELMGTYGRLK